MLHMYKSDRPKNALNWYRAFLIVLFALFGALQTQASHLAGADLTYQYIGNGNYIVTYTFYRDCAGITAPTSVTLRLESASCGIQAQSITMTQDPTVSGQEITPTCSTSVSTCNGGTSPGIQVYQYTALINLPQPCPDWHMWVSDCCRNDAITTIQNASGESLYIEAYLNNTVYQSSSPTFSNVPIVFFCIGQTNFFNHGAVDTDGDSLVYYFIPPRDNENVNLTYNPGYSISNPVSSSPAVSISSSTGDIRVTPTQPEIGVIAVLVEEYRNGVLIGRVMRDIQVYTVACSNQLPSLSGVNGSQSFSIGACAGAAALCFDVVSDDTNSGDSLWLSWNQGIPGATFNPGTGPRPVGTFCWAPSPSDARPNPYTFTVTVHDNSCPSPGVQTYSYSILVSALSISVTSTPSVPCFGDQTGSASATATAGIPPFSFLWSTGDTTSSVNNLGAGNYTVDITDGTGCVGQRTFTITQPPVLNVSVTGTSSACTTGPGSATAAVTGGTPNYSYAWNTNPVQNTAIATNLAPGNYTVVVTDDNQCTTSGSTVVTGSDPVLATLNVTDASCAANDGAIDVIVTSGTAPYSYAWNPNVSTTSSATGLTVGVYEVTVSDASGCSSTFVEIVSSTGINAGVISQSDATCSNSEDGSATIGANGGQPPYSYLWMPNGDTTATVNNLAPGNYSILVTDYLGCSTYAFATIGSQFTAPVVDLGPDSIACNGSVVVLDAGPGATYLWSDNSTNQTLNVSAAGTYSVLVTDQNGCQNFDAINITYIQCSIVNPGGGVSQIPVDQAFTVFPNPARDYVEVNIGKIRNTMVRITLTDILGNQLFTSAEMAEYNYHRPIDLSKFAAGIYLIKVEYGSEMKTVRMIKD